MQPSRMLELVYPFGRSAIASVRVSDSRRQRHQLSFAHAPWQPLLGGCAASTVSWPHFVRRMCEQCGIVLSDSALTSLASSARIDPAEVVLAGRERRPHFELLLRTHFAAVDNGRTVADLDAHLLRKGFGSSALSVLQMMNKPKHGLETSSLPFEVDRSEAHRCKEWQRALEGYSAAIRIAGDDVSAAAYHCYRAQVRAELHDTSGALADAQQARSLAPNWARAAFVHGECCRAVGEWRAAFDSYVRVLRLEGSTCTFDESISSLVGACWTALGTMAAQLRAFSDRTRVSLYSAAGGTKLHPVYELGTRRAAQPRLRRCAEALRMYAHWAQLAHQTLLVLPDVIEGGNRPELPWSLMALSLTELFALSGEYAEAERWGLQALRLAELEPARMPGHTDAHRREQLAALGFDMAALALLNAREVAVASAAGFLGDVYAHAGRHGEAVLMYERARPTWLAMGCLALAEADGGMLASQPSFSAECAQRMALLGEAYAQLGRPVPYASERTPAIDSPTFWMQCSRVPDPDSAPTGRKEQSEADAAEEERLERKLLPSLMQVGRCQQHEIAPQTLLVAFEWLPPSIALSLPCHTAVHQHRQRVQINGATSSAAEMAAALNAIGTIASALLHSGGGSERGGVNPSILTTLLRLRGSETLLHELGYRRMERREGGVELVHSGVVNSALLSWLLADVSDWRTFLVQSLEANGMSKHEAQTLVADAGKRCLLSRP